MKVNIYVSYREVEESIKINFNYRKMIKAYIHKMDIYFP